MRAGASRGGVGQGKAGAPAPVGARPPGSPLPAVGVMAAPAAPAMREGRLRVIIESVSPSVPGGCFAVKRAVGEVVRVEADVFADGHDQLSAVVLHGRGTAAADRTSESLMQPLDNDRWFAEFAVDAVGEHSFTIRAWVDHFKTWRSDLKKRAEAGQDLSLEFLIGAALIEDAVAAAQAGGVRDELAGFAARLREAGRESDRLEVSLDDRLELLMTTHGPRRFAAECDRPVRLWVDRERARFSAWYELFPRSTKNDGLTHGTFRDVITQLARIQDMGFDVLYLPPIHPIGKSFRKGQNNASSAAPGEVGSPWAIGAAEGGHDAFHPQLGSERDFAALVREAQSRGIEIALDLALQCSPDHPWVNQHPEWFKHRPDGSIQYAENPPKKYQDIYPLNFETETWPELWNEVLGVVLVWVERGVRIFRVDNPHTKPFPFWEWLIAQVQQRDPSVLFLAEAFTRPKIMHRLAKLGFTQSYTYFTWRNSPWDLREYFTELTTPPAVDYFRPNAWPNTPDILPGYLQEGGRAAFIARIVLAATLCANWGVYGPALELMEHTPAKPGSEEYLDSEKYQLRKWDLDRPDSLADLFTRLNRIRRENPALQHDRSLTFHKCENESILCYCKKHGDNVILVAVNTDPRRTQWGVIELDLKKLGIEPDEPFVVHDLLTNARYQWKGPRNTVGLDPAASPAHLFRIIRQPKPDSSTAPTPETLA